MATRAHPPRPARDGSLVERCGIPHNKTSRRDDTFSVIPAGHCFAPEVASGPHRTRRPYQAFVPDGTRSGTSIAALRAAGLGRIGRVRENVAPQRGAGNTISAGGGFSLPADLWPATGSPCGSFLPSPADLTACPFMIYKKVEPPQCDGSTLRRFYGFPLTFSQTSSPPRPGRCGS